MLLRDGALTVRPLRDGDADTLLRWLSDPRVLEFYEGRDAHFTPEAIREKFFDGELSRCIIEWEGIPAGYLQYYPLDGEGRAEYQFDGPEKKLWAADQFLGEPSLWGKGLGRRFLTLLLSHLFEEAGAEAVLLDPHAGNERAIRCYERCGFRKEKLLPAHELHEGEWRDCLLMVCRKTSFPQTNIPERRSDYAK